MSQLPEATFQSLSALRVDGLTKNYGTLRAVDNIRFDVPRGQITGLLGGNGAGKTTTIAMLLGLVRPTGGAIEILGVDAIRERYRVLPHMNFESPYVDMPHRLTVRQNLRVYGKLYGVANVDERIALLSDDLELGDFIDKPTGKLSAGQKTRASLAKALINEPLLLMLDEPTASLDPDTADWVRQHLSQYCADRGASMLLASHNMGEVERLCREVLMMRDGRIVARGTPNDLISKYGRRTMEEVFLDIARGNGKAAAE